MKVKFRKSYQKEEEDGKESSFFITDIKVANGKKHEKTYDNI